MTVPFRVAQPPRVNTRTRSVLVSTTLLVLAVLCGLAAVVGTTTFLSARSDADAARVTAISPVLRINGGHTATLEPIRDLEAGSAVSRAFTVQSASDRELVLSAEITTPEAGASTVALADLVRVPDDAACAPSSGDLTPLGDFAVGDLGGTLRPGDGAVLCLTVALEDGAAPLASVPLLLRIDAELAVLP